MTDSENALAKRIRESKTFGNIDDIVSVATKAKIETIDPNLLGPELFVFPNGMLIGQKESTCGRKIRYGREPTATKAAAYMGAKYGKEFEAYSCSSCTGWHIGKPTIWSRLRKLWGGI